MSSSDPDSITDIEQDSSYEEENTENIFEEVELGHIRILNMENLENKKRSRDVHSSGDVVANYKRTKKNVEDDQCVKNIQNSETSKRRKILIQRAEENVKLIASKNSAISKEIAVNVSSNESDSIGL